MLEILQIIFEGSEVIGTIAFAASGAMLAIDRRMDIFGVLFLGATVACGGGIVRDIILGVLPPNAFVNAIYVIVAVITALAVFLFAYCKGERYWANVKAIDHAINWLDAIGLGIFSVIGSRAAMECGYGDNIFLCTMMGMMTGCGGGILRDIFSDTIPAVFTKRVYAVASILGSIAYYAVIHMHVSGAPSMLIGMMVTIVIRVLSTTYEWSLPKVPKSE